MNSIIKTILAEWDGQKIPKVIQRDIDLSSYLNLKVNKIVALTGFRRVGKTYIIYSLIQDLLKSHGKKDVVYINFEDERIPRKTEFLTHLLPEIIKANGKLPEYLFLDEIQNIPDWSRWLRRIHDQENMKIFVTGSSSKLSSKEIPTELRGRNLEIKVYPLSFKEFLRFRNTPQFLPEGKNIPSQEGINTPQPDGHLFQGRVFTVKQLAEIQFHLEEYLKIGGMPEIILSEEARRREIILQYFSTMVRRDIVERYKVRSEETLKALIQLVLNSTLISISRLHHSLASMQLGSSKSTIAKYIQYLENSFFLETVPAFSPKIKNQLQVPKKSYLIDNGFISFLTSGFSHNYGRLLENLAFLELKRKLPNSSEIYYWKDYQQKEVDFVIKEGLEVKSLIQVCYEFNDHRTQEREIAALIKAAEEFNCSDLMILTKEKEEVIEKNNRKIKVMPMWKWMEE